jgi:phage terminase small subunit
MTEPATKPKKPAKARAQARSRLPSGLTPKERHFIREYLSNGGNQTQAAINAGYGNTEESSATLGSRLLRKVEIQRAIERMLTTAGLNDETLMRCLYEGLEAVKLEKNISAIFPPIM